MAKAHNTKQPSQTKEGDNKLVSCPTCNKTLTKPSRTINAPTFKIDEYECEDCGKRFRIIT